MTRSILFTTVGSKMSLLKRIFWKILVIAILSVSVKCGSTENHINISLSLSNSTKTEWINDILNAVEGKFDAFEDTVSSNVSKYAENVSVQMDKFQQAVDTKLITIQGKFDAFEAKISNFVRDIKKTLFKPSTSCTNIFANPILNRGNGIYDIYLNENSSPLAVFCLADPKGGLPWTVVQRRVDASVDFYRSWADYKEGFGDLKHNFFIGLDHLYSLTNTAEPQELWVKLTDPDGITEHAYYDLFAIGNEDEKYALKELGKFSGNAGDSFSHHKGCKFTTFDRDNDVERYNCAERYKGAWWYKACHKSNLNAIYGSTEFGNGVNWDSYRGPYVSMRYAHMGIRPIRK